VYLFVGKVESIHHIDVAHGDLAVKRSVGVSVIKLYFSVSAGSLLEHLFISASVAPTKTPAHDMQTRVFPPIPNLSRSARCSYARNAQRIQDYLDRRAVRHIRHVFIGH
jgi:hypothetical protein